ncbi:MAG: hypothetical protein ACRDNJ_12880 [Solirubrobacteraceae bacterium]
MSRRLRETVSDWLMALAAPLLLGSLFMAWSHQFSRAFERRWGDTSALRGVPPDPTAWQLYSAADVLLALVAAGLLAVSLWGGRARRVVLALALAVALAFTAHAAVSPPTNGATIFDAATGAYVPNDPSTGAGEYLALAALALGAAGVAVAFTADP